MQAGVPAYGSGMPTYGSGMGTPPGARVTSTTGYYVHFSDSNCNHKVSEATLSTSSLPRRQCEAVPSYSKVIALEYNGCRANATFSIRVQNGKYLVNGTASATLMLALGNTYTFVLDTPADAPPIALVHPFKLSKTSDGTHGGGAVYAKGVAENAAGNELTFTPEESGSFYFFCTAHPNMGGSITVFSQVGTTPSTVSSAQIPGSTGQLLLVPDTCWTMNDIDVRVKDMDGKLTYSMDQFGSNQCQSAAGTPGQQTQRAYGFCPESAWIFDPAAPPVGGVKPPSTSMDVHRMTLRSLVMTGAIDILDGAVQMKVTIELMGLTKATFLPAAQESVKAALKNAAGSTAATPLTCSVGDTTETAAGLMVDFVFQTTRLAAPKQASAMTRSIAQQKISTAAVSSLMFPVGFPMGCPGYKTTQPEECSKGGCSVYGAYCAKGTTAACCASYHSKQPLAHGMPAGMPAYGSGMTGGMQAGMPAGPAYGSGMTTP
jgi:hypothetical protein